MKNFNELYKNKENEAAFDLLEKEMQFFKMPDINGDRKVSKDEFIRIMNNDRIMIEKVFHNLFRQSFSQSIAMLVNYDIFCPLSKQ